MKLLKEQDKRRGELVDNLRAYEVELQAAHEIVGQAVGEYNEVLARYNDIASELGELRDEVVADIASFMGDKSERWAESEAGQAHEAFKGEWEGIDIPDELEPAAEVDEPALGDLIEALENLPGAPE